MSARDIQRRRLPRGAARVAGQAALAGVWVGLLAAILALSGCEGLGGTTSTPGTSGGTGPAASPGQHALLENIPLPLGFRMVPERSVARASGQMRVAQCEFEGSNRPDEVVKFFLNYMPGAKFVLKTKRFDNGEYTLRFESDAEECNIRVRPGKTKSVTVLVVDVGPLAKGTAEREAKPPAHP